MKFINLTHVCSSINYYFVVVFFNFNYSVMVKMFIFNLILLLHYLELAYLATLFVFKINVKPQAGFETKLKFQAIVVSFCRTFKLLIRS